MAEKALGRALTTRSFGTTFDLSSAATECTAALALLARWKEAKQMPFYCECAKILTLIEEYRLTILPSEVSKRWRVLSNDCHPANRKKFFGETLSVAISKAIDYETKRHLEKEANGGK